MKDKMKYMAFILEWKRKEKGNQNKGIDPLNPRVAPVGRVRSHEGFSNELPTKPKSWLRSQFEIFVDFIIQKHAEIFFRPPNQQ